MVDIAISVAAKIAEYLVAPVGRPFRYLWNYKTNLENLKNEVEKLKAKRDTVQLSITPGENPMPDVEFWQGRANRIIVEVSEVVVDNPEQANIQCCKGFSCPNLIYRYQLSKKAGGKLKSDVVDLVQEAAEFKQFSYPTIPDEPWLRSGNGYEAYESRRSNLNNIIDALRNPGINMVGIHGMGGIGKTTLARKVAIQTKQANIFHVIVFVDVSNKPNIKNIQQAIGVMLGLKFHDNTEGGQARALYDRLKKEVSISKGADSSGEEKKERADNSGEEKREKKILLIFDNIWEKIDLEKVGIPFGGDCKGLKLLLTTRRINVLTDQMNSHCNFSIETLKEAEAWSLFKSTAGTCVDHPDLKSIALEVAKKCGNMPLAIVTIANALKNKEESIWRNALNELKNPSLETFVKGEMTKEEYTSIKFSYEYLDTDELREIFLLCSRMGCTYDASIRDLFMYGLGLGFFKSSNTLEEAQCKVEALVKKLKDNSLLLDAPNETRESLRYGIPDGERFAMHDVICDVARSIDFEKGNVCNVIDDVILCNWAKKDMLKNCTSITLYNISEVPKDLRSVFPQLEFFYMKTKNTFSRIADDFFAEMSRLQVLHLIELNLSPLPTSFSHLVNLQTLCLDACKLGDIVDIGKLKKLEILSFRGSEIRELPEEMRQLNSIRLLDLTHCFTLEIIPPNVISCFAQLEALYIYGTLIRWEDGGRNIVGRNAILDELKHLRDRLTTLEICVPNVNMSEGLLSPQLKRYKISIYSSYRSEWEWPPKISRTLRVHLNANDNADEVISQLNGIKQLELCADREDDFTKQSVSAGALSSLESLSLEDLNFEKICNVPLAADSFCQLRTITVHQCDKLTNIFSFSIDRVLPKLQEIRVCWCENMEGIFAIEREDDVNNSELTHEIQFSQLCSVSLYDLPQLKSFCHRVKTTSQLQLTSSTNDGEIISEDMIDIPKSLFNEKVVFPNLKTLRISGISADKIWHNQLPTMSSSFQNLNRLKVFKCDNLKELFSSSMVNSFVQLQYLEISFCSLLEEMVFMEELKEEGRKDTKFPSLKEMEISYCPNFKGFISNDKIGFPSLKEMKIQGCHKFKEFILNDKVVFPNLETLRIVDISVKKIWRNQLLMMSSSFENLNRLKVNNCDTLKELFSSSMVNSFGKLQYLKITRCSLLEEMVFMEEERKDTQFPLLKEMTIKHCPNFKGLISNDKGFISNDKIGFPSLKAMEIDGCPKLKEFIFNDKVAVPNLEELKIKFMDKLEKIWHNQLVKDSFCKLKSLEVYGCKKLLNVFPSNIYGRLLSLESLEVGYCDSLEEIFDLRELSIYDSQMQIMLSFKSLQRLKVTICRSLRNLFSASILAKEGVVMEEAHASFLFPKLTSLELDDLPELRSFYSGGHKVEGPFLKTLDLSHSGIHGTDEEGQMQQPFFPSLDVEIGFPSLKEMEIERCPKLKGFIFNDKVAIPNIETLEISSIDNLEKIWHNQLVKDSFCKLKSLEVYGCEKLLNVFPSNICGRFLSSLESLLVSNCDSLEEIFDLREPSIYDSQIMLSFKSLQRLEVSDCGSLKNLFSASILTKEGVVMEEAPARFLFPKLTSLRLDDLPKLRSFYPGRHKVEGPVLKTLRLDDCGIGDTDEEGQMQLAFPCLEELTSDEEHITMLCQGQFPESLFDRIKILRVWDNELTVFPFGIIQRCQNLEELSLSGSSYKEIFPHGEDQTQTKIKTLDLFSLHNLKYIWKQNSKLDLIIQHLEVLEVSLCDSLINLMQPPTSFQNPSTSFQNLTSLGVDSSNSSINMGTSSVAKSLVQLTKMRISSCKKITEVIGYHGDVIEDEIIFRKLKSLTLYELPSLTSFCSWNCTLNFPSLETLTVQWCPNMKIFSQGDLTTEKLQRVEIDRIPVKLRIDFDLNTAIQQSYKKANSAKDNVASSSHRFKIDQESIQQSDEEANEDYGASSSDHSE